MLVLCIVMSLGILLFGNAYSGLLEFPLIVLSFFLPTVFHCSGVFGFDFFFVVLWFVCSVCFEFKITFFGLCRYNKNTQGYLFIYFFSFSDSE